MTIKTPYNIGDKVQCDLPGVGIRTVEIDIVSTSSHELHGTTFTRVTYGVVHEHREGFKRHDIVPADRIKAKV